MITKVLLSAAVTLGVAAGIATPASADPNPFGTLGCSCTLPAPDAKAPATDQLNRGIQSGLGYLDGISPRPADN